MKGEEHQTAVTCRFLSLLQKPNSPEVQAVRLSVLHHSLFLSPPTRSDQSHRKQGQQVCKVRAKMGKFILQESSKHMGEYF